MVNKTFETINTFRKRLRFLRGIPESKSYMLYICANSLHICEECGDQQRFGSKNLADLPLPVLVRLSESHCSSDEEIVFSDEEIMFSDEEIGFPDEQIESWDEKIKSSDEKIESLDEEVESLNEETESLEEIFEYLGSQVNLTWTVRKCCDCRKAQGEGLGSGEFEATVPRTSPPPLPKTAFEWCEIYPGFKRIIAFEGYGYGLEVNEDTVLSELEIYYGGALGAEASSKSALEYDGKTKARILWYRQQD
ncbi:hypothetical protein BGZ90_006323 [Linnemannia elongata]|nr:hypothetical protein BGZ90_006323 [Linnemannia elongata]